jgi:hypothetical protein
MEYIICLTPKSIKMKIEKDKLSELPKGRVCFTRVRKIHNFDPEAKYDFKVQIEIAEWVEDPYRSDNPQSDLNAGDSRFARTKPRRAWTSAEFEPFSKHFGHLLDVSLIPALSDSSTSRGDLASASEQVEGTHYIWVGSLDPKVGEKAMHISIVETINPRNSATFVQSPKINPATGEVQTVDGQPIYSNATVFYGKSAKISPIFSDQMELAVMEGRLSLPSDITLEEAVASRPTRTAGVATDNSVSSQGYLNV